jgi:hypothetical protein
MAWASSFAFIGTSSAKLCVTLLQAGEMSRFITFKEREDLFVVI